MKNWDLHDLFMTFFLNIIVVYWLEKKGWKKFSTFSFNILHTWKKSYSKSAIIIVQVRLVTAKVIHPKYYKNSNESWKFLGFWLGWLSKSQSSIIIVQVRLVMPKLYILSTIKAQMNLGGFWVFGFRLSIKMEKCQLV